jgi:diguanylate cyclase (GGDEF)-like protein
MFMSRPHGTVDGGWILRRVFAIGGSHSRKDHAHPFESGDDRERSVTALDSGPRRALTVFGITVGCTAVLLGLAALFDGSAPGMSSLNGVPPGLGTMKANTAAAIVILGTGLALTATGRNSRALVTAAAAIALGLGLVTLAEYALDWNAGIDQWLSRDAGRLPAAYPERPAVATALMISLLGAALLCAQRPALHRVKTFSAVSASLIAWAALNSYLFGAQALREVPLFSSVDLRSAAMMLVLSVALLTVEPLSPPIRMMIANDTGGVVCRWLLPPAIIAPPVLGWLLTRKDALYVFPPQLDWALYAAASSLGSVFLIILLAHRISLIDAERDAALELSRNDPLTGLANRRAFDSFLLENFNLAKRHGHTLSLMLLDIDWFKTYNDGYGHPAGDDLLRAVAVLLSSLARETDLAARVGGEEFAIVLPETDLAGAHTLAERVRTELERSSLFRRRVTVSIGVAAVTDLAASATTLVKECDAALYRAKEGGRNRVSS